MAILHYASGDVTFSQRVVLGGTKKFFSMYDMILLLGGPTQPFYHKGTWVFVNANNMDKKLHYNKIGSDILGLDIYVSIITADSPELESHFFVPPKSSYDEAMSLVETFLDKSQMRDGVNGDKGDTFDGLEMDKEIQELIDETLDEFMTESIDHFYDYVFNNKVSPDAIDFSSTEMIEQTGIENISDPQVQINLLEIVLEHYQEKEEYERCGKITSLLEKIRENIR